MNGEWKQLGYREPGEVTVGVLGLGEMGLAVAQALHKDGYRVNAWSRSPKALPGIGCFHGDNGLDCVLGGSDVIACLVPLTDETRGLLDEARLGYWPGAPGGGDMFLSSDVT
jgi:glyoxylate/hydroxypyruvate reductase A